MAADPTGGYWIASTSGAVALYGGAGAFGSPAQAGITLNKPIVGMAPTPDGGGYWLVASDGGVFAFGDAVFWGSTGSITLNQPIVGMAPTPDGGGYWLVASDGGIFSFGDAVFWGSTGSITLNQPIVGMAPTPDGGGYWLVASDGGIFSFGDAAFNGSTGGITLNKPIVAMAPTPDGGGYWLVASDGGVFAFGDAHFFGSLGSSGTPTIGIIVDRGIPGYGLVAANGAELLLPSDVETEPSTTPTTNPSPPTTGTTTTSTTTMSAPTTTTTTPLGNGLTCGGVGPAGLAGTWTCTFDDEFNGTALDSSNWVVQQTADSGYATGAGGSTACYMDNANDVWVSGGLLHLSVVKMPAPFTCSDLGGDFTTQYTAGMVSTDDLFSQTYGAFEVRAELPALTVKGLQETLWLWPQNQKKYGAKWPDSGEIDFAEFYSDYPTFDIPYIHYNEASTDSHVTADCVINPLSFNTYGVDWQPGSITVTLNGTVCLVDHPNPAAPLVAPEPFDQPFFIVLTQALGVGSNAPTAPLTTFPATTLIDWVRAWSGGSSGG
jgi:beta-glucanase (GH16 family)